MSCVFTKWKEFHQEMSPLQICSGFLYCNQYSYSWISAPGSLVAIFNVCHCTRLYRLKKPSYCCTDVCCNEASVVHSQSAV